MELRTDQIASDGGAADGTMGQKATLTITTGPDRGKVFELADELVHIGSGAGSQVAINDGDLAEHQASIIRRNGRYAIYSPYAEDLQVDGNAIPPQRWVWLPETAHVKFGQRTSAEFRVGATAPPAGEAGSGSNKAVEEDDQTPIAAPYERRSRSKRSAAPRGEKRTRQVARFITDRPGETLVQLGADGHLPELTLAAGPQRAAAKPSRRTSRGGLLNIALVLSVVISIALLWIEPSSTPSLDADQAKARETLNEFYGTGKEPLQPYQQLLREAAWAHSRGDRQAERAAFRSVLALLNVDDTVPRGTGLTGGRQDDERLREKLAILLRE